MKKKGAQYAGLSRVTDEPSRTALKILMDRMARLEHQVSEAAALNALGKQIVNVADPRAGTDAVNLRYLQQALQANRGIQAVPTVTPPAGIPGEVNTIPSDALPLYDGSAIVQAVFAAFPGYVATSCQTGPGGTWDLMDAIVDALRAADTRFAYNGKRGNTSDPSHDAISYDYAAVPGGEGSSTVYIVDVIAGHCGDNPQPAWNDVTVFAPGAWISRGRF